MVSEAHIPINRLISGKSTGPRTTDHAKQSQFAPGRMVGTANPTEWVSTRYAKQSQTWGRWDVWVEE